MAPGGPASLRTVSIGAMRDVQDDDGASVLIDLVANTPVRSAAGRILPGILVPQQMADAVRVLQQRASEELGRGRSDLPPPPARHLPVPRWRPGSAGSCLTRSSGGGSCPAAGQGAPGGGYGSAVRVAALLRGVTISGDGREPGQGSQPYLRPRGLLCPGDMMIDCCDVRSHVVSESVEGGWRMPGT